MNESYVTIDDTMLDLIANIDFEDEEYHSLAQDLDTYSERSLFEFIDDEDFVIPF